MPITINQTAEQPAQGGSYVRQPDGSLRKLYATEPAAAALRHHADDHADADAASAAPPGQAAADAPPQA